jgi:HK97 family phage major capsid protein
MKVSPTPIDKQQKRLSEQIATLEAAAPSSTGLLSGDGKRFVPSPIKNHLERLSGEYSRSNNLKPFLRELSDGYKETFGRWLRGSSDALSTSERNRLIEVTREVRTYSGLSTSTSGDAAGYTTPIGFQRELETKMKAFGRMRTACRILNTATGNTLDWPTMDDVSNSGEFLAQASPVSQQNPPFGQVQFQLALCSSKQVLLSVQLFQDSAFDVESELSTAFAIRIGRSVNDKYTNGSGSGEPQGLVYAIKNDASPNVVNAVGSAGNTGGSETEANSVETDDLDNLIAAVDPLYRDGAKFMMPTRRSTLTGS